ncbi:MAG: hypothetical protein WCJ95_18720 [Mariniphaga sp.]
MEASNSNNKQPFNFAKIAKTLGSSEEETIQFARENGLIDENGYPTEHAINEGLKAIEEILNRFRITGFSSN